MSSNVNHQTTLASTPEEVQTPQTQASFTRIRLRDDTPLSELNAVFPDGIPIELVEGDPELLLNGTECHVLAEDRTPEEALNKIVSLVLKDEVPLALQVCLTEYSLVAIPAEWVELEPREAA